MLEYFIATFFAEASYIRTITAPKRRDTPIERERDRAAATYLNWYAKNRLLPELEEMRSLR
jgi:hypothetical protein